MPGFGFIAIKPVTDRLTKKTQDILRKSFDSDGFPGSALPIRES